MCGICGIVKLNGGIAEEHTVRQMMEQQRHRGPNDDGVYCQNNTGLGFVRLSILDLSMAGHQPMTDESGRYVIVFNGEIYNYIELREDLEAKGITFHSGTDTEVLLKSYIYYGKQCLDSFNGMFAFVILDKETNRLFVARDRFGVKPLYYYQDETIFCFASEIPAILSVYGQQNKANEQSVFDYLVYNRTDQTEDTFFVGVKKLMHGHYLEIENKEIRINRWYDVSTKLSGEQKDKGRFKELLTDAIRLRLRSDVPVGICLSGGLDSSTISSIVSEELGRKDVNTFSAIYDKHDKSDESKFIHLYSDRLENMFYVSPDENSLLEDLDRFISIQAEPIPSTGPYAQYSVMRLAQTKVTVTLDGQGADEILAGYHYFYGFYFKQLLREFRLYHLIKELTYYTFNHKSLYGLKTFIYFLLPSKLKSRARINQRGYLDEGFANQMHKENQSAIVNELYQSKNLKAALINHLEYKLEHLLSWNDKNSMCFSVESRTPFLDYRLVEHVLSLSDSEIIHHGFTKAILRSSMKGLLPEAIRLRKDKKGFSTPQDKWFRTEKFQKLIFEILDSPSFKSRAVVDPQKARELYQDYLNNKHNKTKDIWKIIHLELWYRKYIDQ